MLANRILLVSAVVLTLTFGGCERFKSPEALYRDAQRLHQNGDDAAAVIQLKSVVQKTPDFAAARYLLGVSYNGLGQYPDAEKELRRALQLGYDPMETNAALADALLGQGQYKKVLDEIHVPANASPESAARLKARLGMAKLQTGDKVGAAQDFEEARRLVPKQVDAMLGQARIAALEQHPERALKLTDEVLGMSPRNKDAGLLKAAILRIARGPDAAVEAYKAVLSIDPKNVAAYVGLISSYLEQGKTETAREQVEIARKAVPNNLMLRYTQGQVSLQEKKFAQARDAALDVLKAAPNFIPANLLLGMANLALGASEQAAKSLAVVVAQVPQDAFARRTLASAQLLQHQPERVLETLKPLLDAGSQDAKVLAIAGDAYAQLNQPAKATDYFERAVKVDPASTSLRTGLGFARLAGGQIEQGLADLKAAAVADPAPARADFALISLLIKQNQFDQALKAIDDLAKKEPNSPVPHYLRGTVYVGKGQLDLARASFEQAMRVDAAYFYAAVALANMDMKNNDRASARKRFETVLAKDKDNLVALLALSAFATQDKNEAEAFKLLEHAAKAHPAALEPASVQAQLYLAKKEPQKALDVARKFQVANPELNGAIELLGATQEAAGEKQGAVTTFTQLAQRLPDSPEAQFRLARAHLVAGNTEGARRALNQALVLRPDYFDAEAALFSMNLQAKEFDDAKRVAQQVQKNHPKIAAGYVMQGDLAMTLKQYPQAMKSYESAATLGRNSDVEIRIHQAAMAAGQRKAADIGLLAWLKGNPSDRATRYYLAQVYMASSQNKEAIEQYEIILKAEPSNALIMNNLAWLYHQTRDARALSTAEQAYKLRPDVPLVADTLGWILVEEGNTARGVEVLEKAHAGAKDQPEITFHYAAALIKAGNKAKGQPLLAELIKSGKTFPQIEEAKRLLAP
jgi:putative PEP-CTERM system TPR-repeat lipoprotein